MKRLSIAFAVTSFSILLVSESLWSQDYHPFPDDKIRTYEMNLYGKTFETFSVVVEERELSGDMEIIHLNRHISNNFSGDFLCLKEEGENWFATTLTFEKDSLRIFTPDGLSFLIPTFAGVDEDIVWVAGSLPDDNVWTVQVVFEGEQQVLGSSEIIKEFYFQVFDQQMQSPQIDHFLHDRSMRIGAESGLLECFTFGIPHENDPMQGHYILKSAVENMDEIRPTILDLFPFELGDSLHVLETVETVTENRREEIRYEVIEKSWDAQSKMLSLVLIVEYFWYENLMGDFSMESGVDTIELVIDAQSYNGVNLPPSYQNLLPGEFDVVGTEWKKLMYYHLTSKETSDYEKRGVHFFEEFLDDEIEPDCILYAEPNFLPTYHEKHFIEGLGGPYFYINDVLRKPVFASVGGERWGEPLDFTVSVDEITDEQIALELFPNPIAQGERLTLKTNRFGEKQIHIYNIQGTKVHSVFGIEDTFTISTSYLPKGTYILRVIEGNSPPVTQKFMVR